MCCAQSSSRSEAISGSTERGPGGGLAAVVVDALAAPADPELRARLGPELDDHLHHVVRERALAWARRAAGGAEPLQARRAEELPELLAGHDGPVLLVAPDVPGLSDHHLAAVLDDLDAGVLMSSGPSGDGTPCVVALARVEPRLLALASAPFDQLAAAALELGGELGMLRAERRLVTVADALAIRADPQAPQELRDLLAGLR
jgi:hypothetical protein